MVSVVLCSQRAVGMVSLMPVTALCQRPALSLLATVLRAEALRTLRHARATLWYSGALFPGSPLEAGALSSLATLASHSIRLLQFSDDSAEQ